MDKEQAINISILFINFLIKNGYNIKKAFLFGSFVKGNFHEDSDIDIALFIDNISNSYLEMINIMKLRRNFDLRIEPHPFHYSDFNSDNPFTNEIKKNRFIFDLVY